MSTLYGYQQTGAEWLAGRKHALLADEMGLGKSAQAIAACVAAKARDRCVLVICPASVRENWKREFARFSNLTPIVQSYDGAARNALNLSVPEGDHWDVLILDEAHYLKSATAKRTRAIFGEKCDGVGGLVERADRVILLSGTPMPNHPAEIWPALRALWPEQITGTSGKPYSYWQFVSKFCKTKDNGFGIQIVGAKNHDLLREKLEPVMLRRLKADVLPDLPEITFEPLFVEGKVTLDEASTHMTWAIAETLDKEGVEGLKRIAPHVATLRRLTGMAKVAPVVEWVKEWLDGCDRKIVLFAHHREVIAELFNTIGTADAVVVAGSTSDRQAAVDEFQKDPACRVFIGQNTAAGTGITLTAASDLLMLEPSWTPSDNAQIAGRIHRIGQKNGCQVRFVTLAGSIDEQIGKALARKAADISAILDEPNVGI